MNPNLNNINGNPPNVPVNPEGNPANLPAQPIQEVPVQQVLPDLEDPVIPVEVPAGINPIEPTWLYTSIGSALLEKISTEPFTLEKAIEVFDVFEKSNLTYLMLDRMNNESNLIECVKYVINNYPHDIINDESFLDIIRVLLSLRKHQEPSRFCLLHTNDLLSFFRKVSPLALMEEKKWKKYFEDVFLDCIEFSLGKKEDHYSDRIKLFLILFGENKDYCEMLFDQTYCKNQDIVIFKELFAKSEKTEEEFKIYLKNKLFGSNILFYLGISGDVNLKPKNYYEFLDEKSKGLHHPFLCHHSLKVKSAKNVASKIIEIDYTTSNDDGKPTEGKKEEKEESSE